MWDLYIKTNIFIKKGQKNIKKACNDISVCYNNHVDKEIGNDFKNNNLNIFAS